MDFIHCFATAKALPGEQYYTARGPMCVSYGVYHEGPNLFEGLGGQALFLCTTARVKHLSSKGRTCKECDTSSIIFLMSVRLPVFV